MTPQGHSLFNYEKIKLSMLKNGNLSELQH